MNIFFMVYFGEKTGIAHILLLIPLFFTGGCFNQNKEPGYPQNDKNYQEVPEKKDKQNFNAKQHEHSDSEKNRQTVVTAPSKVTKKKDKNKKTKKRVEQKQKNEPGLKVLKMAREFALKSKKIVRGSCWDFVNRIYELAGFGRKNRKTVFKSKKRGPYADIDLIKPGDWIYHVNLEYKNVPHSGIFVEWVDKSKKIARMLAYAGMNRKASGRYKQHRLSRVFRIIRPLPKSD